MISSPIPIFPLGLVLLPGATVPLHIFEPRYRVMIDEVNGSTKRFGIIAPPADSNEADLPPGRIGCIALLSSVELLPDGRSYIVVEGTERFRFETFIDAGTPYRVGHIAAWIDRPESAEALAESAGRVRATALRAISASMTVHDATNDPPTLSADPAALSFQIAQLIRVGVEVQYDLLADQSALSRLERVEALLRAGLPRVEAAAELHVRAKTNGHHHGPPPT